MLRAILGLALLLFVAGLAFFMGRSSVPASVAEAPAPEAPNVTASQPNVEQSRARTNEPATPDLPEAPPVSPDTDLKAPTFPNTVEGQAPGDAAPLYAKGLGLPI